MVEHRSVSQVKTYEECAYRYYLERIERVWQRPAAWFPMGTAVHAAIEAYERSDRTMPLEEAQEAFAESYAKEVNRYSEVTPNHEYWSSSGYRYPGPVDIERRFSVGGEQVGKYYDYVERHPERVIWIDPDGNPGIELGFDVDLDGVPVKGYIDQITGAESGNQPPDQTVLHDGELQVIDVKTGAKPGDDFQLKLYAIAIKKKYGKEITSGAYWMGKTGNLTRRYDLTKVSDDAVYERFHRADEGIRAGDFPASPEDSKCGRCSVARSCSFRSLD